MGIILLFGLPIIIAFAASYFIYIILRNRLINAGNAQPKTISLIVAIISFILIVWALLFLAVVLGMSLSRGGARPPSA
jgi:hypothetical protein